MATPMSPVTGILEQIRVKVRRITGRPSANQLSENNLDAYINDFYVNDLPLITTLFNLTNSESPLIATTPGGDSVLIAGEWLYLVDYNKYINIYPPFYVDGYEIQYFQDIRKFMSYFGAYVMKSTLATGTGIAGPYAGTITTTPILPAGVTITAVDAAGNTVVASVDSDGTIEGDVLAGGTIDFTTGAVAGLTWTSVIPLGNVMTANAITYVSGRPQAVLYVNKVLCFYPVPDNTYEFYCNVDYAPDALEIGDQPEVRQWWNVIALGAAMKIFTDNLDIESYGKVQALFDQAVTLAERRSLRQLATQRVSTIYSTDTFRNNTWGFPYN